MKKAEGAAPGKPSPFTRLSETRLPLPANMRLYQGIRLRTEKNTAPERFIA
jgi:hypothetical protein